MEAKLNRAAIEAIETALKKGDDVWIYRSKTGVVVSSQTRKTIYRTVQENGQEKGNQSRVL